MAYKQLTPVGESMAMYRPQQVVVCLNPLVAAQGWHPISRRPEDDASRRRKL
jgi:hypothetical protein